MRLPVQGQSFVALMATGGELGIGRIYCAHACVRGDRGWFASYGRGGVQFSPLLDESVNIPVSN